MSGEADNTRIADAEENGSTPLVDNGDANGTNAEDIEKKDLKVDVKDLINIENFGRARNVKPVQKEEKPSYYYLMPYCQFTAVLFLLVAVIFLALGYSYFKAPDPKAKIFKYVGFISATIGVGAFIAVIYINSVSENSLTEAMRSFRKSRAANPQIDKKITAKKGHNPPQPL